MKRKSNEQYIKEVIQIYKDLYDYSEIKYINNKTKIKIKCIIHGIFEKRPDSFLKGSGCQKCFYEKKQQNQRKSTEQFINQLKNLYSGEYNYSKVDYYNVNTPVIIICPYHGEVSNTPKSILQNNICRLCSFRDTKQFIKESNKVHKNRFLYNKVEYIATNKKVIITCKKHGDFKQEPRSHLRNIGCPKCKLSKGEKKIMDYLNENKIKYNIQIRIIHNKKLIIYDFYLIDKKIFIEYDGSPHFQDSFYGSVDTMKKKDKIKDEYILKNNLKLFRIHYKDYKNIDKILKNILLNNLEFNISHSRENYL